MTDQVSMKVFATLLGCLMAFAGTWGAVALASVYMSKAGQGLTVSRAALCAFVLSSLLGLAAGVAFVGAVGRMPSRYDLSSGTTR